MKALFLAAWIALAAAALPAAETSQFDPVPIAAPATPEYVKRVDWCQTLLASRAALARLDARQRTGQRVQVLDHLLADFPQPTDWLLQDAAPEALDRWLQGETLPGFEAALIAKALQELGPGAGALQAELDRLGPGRTPGADPRGFELYLKACGQRRARRLAAAGLPQRIVFTKHYNIGGSHYAYTEGQSDAQHQRHFFPGAALCVLDLAGGTSGTVRTLIDDPQGVIRDPDVAYDGSRILFSWKKSDRQDDYHLYDLDVAGGKIRQLTSGLGFADYEGACLPDGNIVFTSSRCVQTVDCFWAEVSNLYTCDRDGRFLRRLAFDQVHDNHPVVLDDGRVVYTRWEYNDRGQMYVQGLAQMNPDGTGQTAFYGNNSWFPTAMLHARGIPGTGKVMAILAGHHTRQAGKLAVIDPAKGREENQGVQLIAPVRETQAVKIDAYGQEGGLFQYPFPLGENSLLVSYAPLGWEHPAFTLLGRTYYYARFGIYFMTADGRRELLASDPGVSCNQPVPLRPRPVPHLRPSPVDYRKATGTFYMQDVYAGPGLAGIARGTAKTLRVVALDYRSSGIGHSTSAGEGGTGNICTPVAIGNGSWDPKIILGDVEIHADGSAYFELPARTPVYFIALDAKGRAIQTMRSWATLQPGENASCVGCHETKNSAPPARTPTLALKAGPQRPRPFYGPARGFSFAREIQPILDRHCVQCHDGAHPQGSKFALAGKFSLSGTPVLDRDAKRLWSEAYLTLTGSARKGAAAPFVGRTAGQLVTWIGSQSAPPLLKPYSFGAARSGLMTLLEQGHKGARLSPEEMEKLACWIDLLVPFCGDYTEASAWTPEEQEKYDHFLKKRQAMEALERQNIAALIPAQSRK